jgi:hypothetical protein
MAQSAAEKESYMLPSRVTLAISLAVLLSWAPTCPAGAAPQAFVSASGDDGDPDNPGNIEPINPKANCGPVSPCRTFAKALDVVDAGGEVVALSSGNYDRFTIRKPVSVVAAPGVEAVITVTSGNAINLATNGAVVLRGLTLNGRGGAIGIQAIGVDVLHVEDCILDGFSSNAISFGMFGGQLYLRDMTVRNSGSDFASAVFITSGFASIDRLRMDRNRHGLVVDGGQVTISNSVATEHGVHAIWARGLTAPVDLAIENCTIEGSGFVNSGGAGIVAGNPSGVSRGARMSVSNSTITNSDVGISAAQSAGTATKVWVSNTIIIVNGNAIVSSGGAAILSRGNNMVEDNFPPDNFTGGFSAK